jgi:hypothetical protein
MRPRSVLGQTVPHFSLPQRLITDPDPSAQIDALEDPPAPPQKRSDHRRLDPRGVEENGWDDEEIYPVANRRISAPMLALKPLESATAITRPLDLQLIPAPGALPRLPQKPRRWWQAAPTSRITFGKIVLFGAIFFGVLGTTLATAGGGPVLNLLLNAFHTVSPSAAAVSLVSGDPVAQRVRPITQANSDAGYDSQAQHDTWWNSVCSAAAFTEVAKAWGITNVSIGQVLDRLLDHDPPYISVSGGLLTPDGWGWMAAAYHMHAQVDSHAFTFDQMVQRIQETGVPIVLNMKGGNVNSPWGHFVVMVGGDENQAQIVDSSTWRMTSLPRSFFTEPTYGVINDPIWWSGISIILTAD